MKFSIVVPTYNEEKDIAVTLESLVALDWPEFEIIVVDDSTDRTPAIVRGFESRGVRLIRPEKREGRCGARNLGILGATGEVVVILNADVRLPNDFFRLIAPHYEQGADYVLVSASVENMGDLFGRYVESVGLATYYDQDPKSMEWTEGFSCRRKLAIAAGMFPTGFAVPICAGEDGFFGQNLRDLGARKKIDLSVVVKHVAPASLQEYWYIRKGRGQGSPQVRRFLQGWSLAHIALWAALRVVRSSLMAVTVLPMVWVCSRFARKSPKGYQDVLPFCWAWMIEQAAFIVGEWRSLGAIHEAEKRIGNMEIKTPGRVKGHAAIQA